MSNFATMNLLGQRRQACRRAHPHGLTLVEILTTLLVLAVGLGSVLSIVVRSANMGNYAADRNCAQALISEALDDIQRTMVVSPTDAAGLVPVPGKRVVAPGELFDTISLGAGSPFNDVQFQEIRFNNVPNGTFLFKDIAYFNGPSASSLAYWPFSTKYSRIMGSFPTAGIVSGKGGKGDSVYSTAGQAYRALWKLEPHPDWMIIDPATGKFKVSADPVNQPNPNESSSFVGVYLVTVAIYRDLEPTVSTFHVNSKNGLRDKRLEQITDPVVIQVRDKRVRQ